MAGMPSNFLAFLGLAILVVLAPGPDFAVVTKNCLAHGRPVGVATSLGVVSSLLIQGLAAALGVAALVVHSATVFTVLKIVGAVYLGYLGLQALRSALARGGDQQPAADGAGTAGPPGWPVLRRGYRQGFLSNITNPKVLAFYFALLPQFVSHGHPALPQVLLLAATHAMLALIWLLILVTVLDQLRAVLRRPKVRRTLEAVTGAALVGLGVRLLTATSGS